MSSDTTTHPDIPEQSWENPFPEGHPIHDLYERRVRNEQDLVIIVDDYHARRGTGKTIASLQLAEGMDQNGGLTWENVSLRPEQIRSAYSDLPPRSALILDEGELGASNREAMTKVNKALREIVSIGRVEQKYVVINTPDIGFIDKDIRKMADIWMTMLRKGLGLIHYLKRNPYAKGGNGAVLREKNGLIEFNDVQRGTDLRDVYNRLTREKRKHIGGDEADGFIPVSEHEEKLRQAKKQAKKNVRNELVAGFYNHPETGAPQRVIAEVANVSQKTVSNVVREGAD